MSTNIIYAQEYGSFTDERDGRVYKTVKIGYQIWMAENLAYECEDSYCYNDNPDNCIKFGRIYSRVIVKKAYPKGWHIPQL